MQIHALTYSRYRVRKLSVHLWDANAGGETPVPIPNTAVKPSKADGSVVVRLCESR